MKISIFGAGYVGLVTAACLAELGNEVCCIDVNQDRILKLNQGGCPIHEPGLPELITKNCKAHRLTFTHDAKLAIAHGHYLFIAVGTPQDEDGSADMRYVLDVAQTMGESMAGYKLIITKSTVPVGTAARVQRIIQTALSARKVSFEFDVVSNPEFLREGAAIKDFMNSDRIIVGATNPRAAEQMQLLYAPLNRNHDRLIMMDVRSAELTKYAANAFLATKISFINEMSQMAERLGADIDYIRRGIGSDPRIGHHFINPSCGYGGSCFPKDIMALAHMAKSLNYELNLINAVHAINKKQKRSLFEKMEHYFKGDLSNKTIAIWGLAFKPDTDDMREASSRDLMEALWQVGARVQAYDPVAKQEVARIYGSRADLTLCDSPMAALDNADALAILTEWKDFYSPDFQQIKQCLKTPAIFDGRNLYDPQHMAKLGFTYYGIGRGESCKMYG